MASTNHHTNAVGDGDGGLLSTVRAFQQGRRGEFDRLYAALWGPLVVRASRMGLGSDESEEIAQRTLVRVYRYAAAASFGRVQQFWAWVYTIARREVYKLWRKQRPEAVREEAAGLWGPEAADPATGPADAAAMAEAVRDARACTLDLEDSERAILLGVVSGGLTFRRAARTLGLTLGQFKHRYECALRKVRCGMRARGHDVA